MTAPGRSDSEWQALATAILRGRMKATEVGVTELSRALGRIGVRQSVTNIATKLAAGTFSTAFFLQVLIALRIEEVDLSTLEGGHSPNVGASADPTEHETATTEGPP